MKTIRIILLLFLIVIPALRAQTVNITVACEASKGTVSPNIWAVGAPDKYHWWAGNQHLKQRISDAKIRLVRVNPTQIGIYNGRDIYPGVQSWNWNALDAILNTIWDAGAMPLFVVCGYPSAVSPKDWNAYAVYMEGIVERYNVNKTLGESKTIQYFEMWNEPAIEGDGILSKSEYAAFVETVGGKMKQADAGIKLIGPADAYYNMGGNSWVAYTANNLGNYIDVISWHDYGPDINENDAVRMAWTTVHYSGNITSARVLYPGFGIAITEYNISHQNGGNNYNQKYHNEFGAVYAASAIIQAAIARTEVFAYYNLAETGTNLLGLLSNSDYSPYLPYYTFYLFGNFTGARRIDAESEHADIELLATKSNDEETLFLTVLNKNVEGKAYDLSILLQDVSHPAGEIKIRKLSATDIPTAYALSEYASPEIKHTIPALSIVNFEITPGKYSSALKTNAGITKLKACPNPVSNRTVLSAYLPQASDVEIAIFDVEGRMIEQRKYTHCAAGEFEKEFRFEKYAKGIYIIRLSSQNSSEQALLVKR